MIFIEFLRRAKNLIQNAIEASSCAVIEISASITEFPADSDTTKLILPAGRYIHIEVKDTGPGMSADVAAKAFDPFFSTKCLGRGLGLSAVLGIMRAHNGAVRLDTVQDLGTTVHLFLPVDAMNQECAPSTMSRSATHFNLCV